MLMGTREGVIMTVILGIVGALVGGFLAQALLHNGDATEVNIESIVIAVVGAIVVIFLWRAVAGWRMRSSRSLCADERDPRCRVSPCRVGQSDTRGVHQCPRHRSVPWSTSCS